jgi:nicotinate phosphoribosyltransferase
MRRAQGFGANAAARAALLGGADFTSNTGVSLDLGFPPKGTHAHSMVQLFMARGKGELAAFRSYAEVYPDDCLLLVDTIDTLASGVPNAIRVFEELKKKGHQPLGIRLDSGDLAHLAVESAKMLDRAGFEDVAIVLSNQLDEARIRRIDERIAEAAPKQKVDPDRLMKRLAYGVGTRLVTSQGDGALDGVYKLTAVKEGDNWKPAFKISETPEKTINPGEKQAWRIYDRDGKAAADFLSRFDEDPREEESLALRHPSDPGKEQTFRREEISKIEPLLVLVREEGRPVKELPSLEDIRHTVQADLERLPDGVKKIFDPEPYPVFLTENLWKLKQKLISSYRH